MAGNSATKSGSQPGVGPKCTYCGHHDHGTKGSKEEHKEKCPSYNKTCDNYKKQGHIKAICRSASRVYATEEGSNVEFRLRALGIQPSYVGGANGSPKTAQGRPPRQPPDAQYQAAAQQCRHHMESMNSK